MERIDLHVHSSASDGSLTPSQVVEAAAQAGLKAIALTDHDTVAGVREAMAAAEGTDIEVVPGTELSCSLKSRGQETELHMLGLFICCENGELKEFLDHMIEARQRRNDSLIRGLAEAGIHLSMEELRQKNPGAVITRAHFAEALAEMGVVSSPSQAFKKYLKTGGPCCPPKEAVPPEEAIRLIRSAGGFPVLAHPLRYNLSWKEIEELTSSLAERGLGGLEVYYSSHTQAQSSRLHSLCKSLSLLPTGGSDFHGSKKPDIQIGRGRGGLRVPLLLLEDIKKQMSLS